MNRPGAEAFFPAHGAKTRVEKISKVFPTGGGFVAFDARSRRDAIHRRTGWQRSRDAYEPSFISGNTIRRVFRDHCQRISGTHEKVMAQNHVAVAIGIA